MAENIIDNSRGAEWREELRKKLPVKERTQQERVQMNELEPSYRARCREEVNQGLTEAQALVEASRCMDCPNPTCMQGCPVGINIPGFIKNIERGEFLEAAKVLKQTSALPAVCGRVCPQEKQCESKCTYVKMKKPAVAIGYLERFAADYERNSGKAEKPTPAKSNGVKVAVVGSGPAGLSFAGDMAKKGYQVTVFEALHEIGGVLKYGIPEFRLPNAIVDFEIDNLRALGVNFVKDCIVGKTITIAELEKEGFKGVFVASGAGLPRFMGVKGENLIGIMSSNEYLTRVNLMDASNPETDTPVLAGKKVAVIGGGNTAMDSVRTALRLGAERAMIIYRRGEDEMPARKEEIHHAKEEGITLQLLNNPVRIVGNDKGWVTGLECVRMELGEADASGRRSPIEIKDSNYVLDVDMVVMAIGQGANPLIKDTTPELPVDKKGHIIVDENGASEMKGVFAGGDIVTGAATVISAMGAGKRAAQAIDEYLKNK